MNEWETRVIDPAEPPPDLRTTLDGTHRSKYITIECGRCERQLCTASPYKPPTTKLTKDAPSLPEEHFCRWCARPISERAEAISPPTDALIDFAKAVCAP